MKFGQLIEYTMRNIFFEKQTQNVMDKIVQDALIKNQNLAYLWIESLESYKFVLTVCTS